VDAALRETISTLPEDVVEEAELEMDLQKGTPSDRQLKLEVLRNTNEKLRYSVVCSSLPSKVFVCSDHARALRVACRVVYRA
jgi:hypothetical protein